jgi:hypothetical protein
MCKPLFIFFELAKPHQWSIKNRICRGNLAEFVKNLNGNMEIGAEVILHYNKSLLL